MSSSPRFRTRVFSGKGNNSSSIRFIWSKLRDIRFVGEDTSASSPGSTYLCQRRISWERKIKYYIFWNYLYKTFSLLTFCLKSFGSLRTQCQSVNVILKQGSPVLQFVHDVPRFGHANHEQNGSVGEVAFRQGKLEQILVMWISIKGPNSQSSMICRIRI